MYVACILAGTNQGNRVFYLQKALEAIHTTCGKVLHQSAIYQTAAWGYTQQPAFYNQVWLVETALNPTELMQQLLKIEQDLGRIRTIKMGPRTIDLDILLINHHIINTSLLQIPHPALPQRKFALIPLAELVPHWIHPVEKKSIRTLLEGCTDDLDVHKIEPNAE
jgi:2-amino-4-hydroxy-6-hydroxymethyldihydropteridine diphosphokinase